MTWAFLWQEKKSPGLNPASLDYIFHIYWTLDCELCLLFDLRGGFEGWQVSRYESVLRRKSSPRTGANVPVSQKRVVSCNKPRDTSVFPIMSRALLLAALTLLSLSALVAADERVYELRTYVANPGKLEALLARFRDHTFRLFEKHGMENVGYWVPLAKEDGADTTLIYLLAHRSREAAKASFAAFGKDPEWQAARKASEEGGKLLAQPPESVFLEATDYSPPVRTGMPGGVFELRTYTTVPGKLDALHARFRDHTMAMFSKHGMRHIGYWTPVDTDKGAGVKLIYLLGHDSREAGLESFTAFRADPAWIAAKGASESANGGSLTVPQPEGVKSVYLRATDFSPLR